MTSFKHIAIVHDWLVSMRGGEKVLEVLCELFPDATLFTLVHAKGKLSPVIERMNIKTSFIQKLPFGLSHYQHFLPLYPTAIEQFDLSDFDLVISSSHAVAKGVRVRNTSLHICYCYTPMRYIWDQYEDYFSKDRSSLTARIGMRVFLNYLRRWDVASSKRVHHFIAISKNVQERIKRIYGRESVVIYPPVDVQRFQLSHQNEGYYLIVSALVPYKRIDIAVEAFNQLGERLVIVGSGAEAQKLQKIAKKNIEFVGRASDEELSEYYAGCRALIFPGVEDFGIVPVEAMACGKPVIAFREGGAMETVVENKSGIFFHEQNVISLQNAVQSFEKLSFDASAIREYAMIFERAIFKQQIEKYISEKAREFVARR